MGYAGYNLILTAAFVFALPLLPLIVVLGPRYRRGFLQRMGLIPDRCVSALGSARPVWIHAASVGEVRSAAPLVREIKARAPDRKVLVSTFTATGNRVAADSLGADSVIYLPIDLRWNVRRVLKKLDPALLVVIETEIWPNLLREAFRRGVPTLMLSGRLSEKALPRYARFRGFFRRVLGYFTALGMQSEEDAARIIRLGADERRVSVVGSLKFAADHPWHRGRHLRSVLANGKQWLVAGSTHKGEEEILLSAFASLKRSFPKLSMVLAPRHPERCHEVAKLLQQGKFDFQRKSDVPGAFSVDAEVLLLDTVGELADFFAVGDIAFVGGSLVNAGGHNVLEPARWQRPILFGPHMANFQAIADDLLNAGAALQVRSATDLAETVAALLSDAEKRRRMGALGAEIADRANDALDRNLNLAERYL
jgi:3-deoxy-D-manno-octulosonic-acid transferase